MPKTPFNDKSWRLSHCYKIINKEGKRVTLSPNRFQKQIFASEKLRKLALKARQVGISTGCILDYFDDVLTIKNLNCCILAHENDAIKKLFRIVTRAYDALHPTFKPKLDRGGGSKYELFFPEINSRIYCDLESRGDTIQRLHISEAHFIKDENRIKATMECVPLHGKISAETTPNGIGGWFYDVWNDVNQEWDHFFFPWYLFHEYKIPTRPLVWTPEERALERYALKQYGHALTDEQIAFRRSKINDLKGLFFQEYPEDPTSCFLTSGQSVMDLIKIQGFLNNLPVPIEDKNGLTIMRQYDPSHTYVVGVDTSEGVGQDFSVASFIDNVTKEQAAILRCQERPHDFAHHIYESCALYHEKGKPWPLVGVERNNHGHAVILELDEHIRYENLYRHKDGRYGWVTDRVTRPIMLDTFVDGVENQTVTLLDRNTLQECLTFVDINGKAQAAPGKHDDCIMATAIAIQMCLECSVSQLYEKIKEKILI